MNDRLFDLQHAMLRSGMQLDDAINEYNKGNVPARTLNDLFELRKFLNDEITAENARASSKAATETKKTTRKKSSVRRTAQKTTNDDNRGTA